MFGRYWSWSHESRFAEANEQPARVCGSWPRRGAAGATGVCRGRLEGEQQAPLCGIYVEEKLVVRRRRCRSPICAQARALLAAPWVAARPELWLLCMMRLTSGRNLRTLSTMVPSSRRTP
jgi:hypothetical protein